MNIIFDNYIKENDENGFFLKLKSGNYGSEEKVLLGKIYDVIELTGCFRFNACWMSPFFGKSARDIPNETQFLLLHLNNGEYEIVIPLVDEYERTSLLSEGDDLFLLVETGDNSTKIKAPFCLYVLKGNNPYDMIKTASEEICGKLKTFHLRENKRVPEFADLLGFCTYNAFYSDVTHEKIETLLEDLKKDNINLGYIIIDDGWQKNEGGYTINFEADIDKFPKGLEVFSKEMKEKYSIKEILVWHTYNGYWLGIKKESFSQYEIEDKTFYIPERFKNEQVTLTDSLNINTAAIPFYPYNLEKQKTGFLKTDLFRFYFDFYSYLRKQGINGSKLDAMSWIECFGQNRGGRVKMMQQLVSSLEASSELNFDGEHINCSSCSNDFIFNALKSNVTRSSNDYFPEIEESHGEHIYTNAHTSFWMGEIILPDWDMFQSGNTAGEFHAKSRAISGGPIYYTDNIGMQRSDIILKLATKDGRIGRCLRPASISLESIFTNPKKDFKPIKIFNYNKYGYILGAFNCSINDNSMIGEAAASDINSLKEGRYLIFSSTRGNLGVFEKDDKFAFELKKFDAELFTIVAISDGFAVVGDINKYNPLGFIKELEMKDGVIRIKTFEACSLGVFIEKDVKKVSEPFVNEKGFIIINSVSDEIVIEF